MEEESENVTMDRQNGHTDSRNSRHRAFTKLQLVNLEEAFAEDNYITGERKRKLAEKTELTKDQVLFWFRNRRRKNKDKSEKETIHQTHSSSSQRNDFSESQLATLELAFIENKYANDDQRETLETAFKEDNYLSWETKDDLARKTGLSEKRVTQWFICHRSDLMRHANRAEKKHVVDENTVELMGLTPAQETILLDMFRKHSFLNMGKLADMIAKTGLTKDQVQEWFWRQRAWTQNNVAIKEEPEDEME